MDNKNATPLPELAALGPAYVGSVACRLVVKLVALLAVTRFASYGVDNEASGAGGDETVSRESP